MSLDRDIQKRLADRWDPDQAAQAKNWIENVIGSSIDSDILAALKDGVVLCQLINAIKPSTTKYKSSKMPFVQMEQISTFLKFAKEIGVPEYDLFQTVDLYERKNPAQVIQCIFSFARYAVKCGLDVPILGPKLAEVSPRHFNKEVLQQGKCFVNTYQYGKFSGPSNGLGV
ncbi:Transgelin [Neolecta irregularis DAH-3]|uniref:Transgelin n=1 Tax=Neolecta irregularis (strain DAH-3) TaxID=1198029 RepID=A0A1U7LLZ6_NEOID|nr:Transgelin [Neolecta irregularis DAH-3]|eukprot:OLL23658.1 Transgelin [Neolecta irregularis DAH-3]